ncbi:MAG: Fic family protein [Candidatus Micrarchaeia archaeon]
MDEYTGLLQKLRVADKVRLDKESLLSYLEKNIVKIIFYSSRIEGNRLDESSGELFLESGFVKHDGGFLDYLELLNHEEIYKIMVSLSGKEISIEDVIRVRKELFSGIIGRYSGIRRYRNGIGIFVTSPAENVEEELKETIKILNEKPSSYEEAIINALEFHMKFVRIHPFEDGVGRTARLFMNLYLLKSGLLPIIINENENRVYRNSLEWYHATDHETVFIASMLAFYIGKGIEDYLLEKADGMSKIDPSEVEFSCILRQLLGRSISDNPAESIAYLYDSKSINPRFGLAALWLSSSLKLDSTIIPDAISSTSTKERAAGIYAACSVNIKKYTEEIRTAALKDEDEYNRLLAIFLLARNGLLDKNLAEEILSKEKSEVVLCAISQALTMVPAPYAPELLAKVVHSDSVNIRRRAWQALLANSSDDEVANLLLRLLGEDERVILPSISRLRWMGRLGSKEIAQILSRLAIENPYFKEGILAELPASDLVGKGLLEDLGYASLLESVLSSASAKPAERAVSIYMLGMDLGYSYIKEKHNAGMEAYRSMPEKLAISLVYFDSVKKGMTEPKAKELLGSGSAAIDLVHGAEVIKLLKQHSFSRDFLSLCRKGLKQWQV